jgi:hypothetical protein
MEPLLEHIEQTQAQSRGLRHRHSAGVSAGAVVASSADNQRAPDEGALFRKHVIVTSVPFHLAR